jgi:hypothetical protein
MGCFLGKYWRQNFFLQITRLFIGVWIVAPFYVLVGEIMGSFNREDLFLKYIHIVRVHLLLVLVNVTKIPRVKIKRYTFHLVMRLIVV